MNGRDTHNAFGNLTSRSSTLWDYTSGNWDFEYSMTNNRVWGAYDSDGRQTLDPDDPIDFQYDGAGRMEKTTRYEGYETLMYQDGTGAEAKRSQRTWDTQANNWGAWETVYFINSSVLGRIITETTGTGKKKYTYVVAGGTTIARQEFAGNGAEVVGWQFTDVSGFSSRGFNNEELDGLGNNVGMFPHVGSSRTENSMTAGQSLTHNNMGMGDCSTTSGILGPCSLRDPSFATDSPYPHQIGGLPPLRMNRDNLLFLPGFGRWEDRDDPEHWGGVITEFWYSGPDPRPHGPSPPVETTTNCQSLLQVPFPPGVSLDQNILDTLNKVKELKAQAQAAADEIRKSGHPQSAGMAAMIISAVTIPGGSLDHWFYGMVRDGGLWGNYKRLTADRTYEPFGNFNYGAVGAAAGYSLNVLQHMAGWVQEDEQEGVKSSSELDARLGIGGRWPFGDQIIDAEQIALGYQYYSCRLGEGGF